MFATIPPGTTFVSVSGGTYAANLPALPNAPSGAGVYWNGTLYHEVEQKMTLVVRAKSTGGGALGIGRATINTGALFLDDRLTTYIKSPHPVFLPMVRR
jgi:hypothetical protein